MFFRQRGTAQALRDLGVKTASTPEMGNALYSSISSATGDSGRVRQRTLDDPSNQARSAFLEHDRHLARDPYDDVPVFPVANQQSLNTKKAAVRALTKEAPEKKELDWNKFLQEYAVSKTADLYEDLKTQSPVPVHPHELANIAGGFYTRGMPGPIEGSFIGTKSDKNPYVLAHEIGHAKFDTSPIGKLTQNPAVSPIPATMASILGGTLGGALPKSGKGKALGVLAGATLPMLPTWINEGVASYKGHGALKEVNATPEQLSEYKKSLILPQSSYLALPAAGGIAGLLAALVTKGKLKTAAAHKLHGRRKFRNLDVSIENRKGSYRNWTDQATGEKGRTQQIYPYGYIRMTEGMDGDHIDCYVGPNENATYVYVITTNTPPKFTKADEQKCMLGFDSAKEAKRVFLQHFDDPRFFRSMKAVKYEEFECKALATHKGSYKKIAQTELGARLSAMSDIPVKDVPPIQSHYMPEGNFRGQPSYIAASRAHPFTMAHELGHHQFNKLKPGKFVQTIARPVGAGLSPISFIGSGMGYGLNKDLSPGEAAQYAALTHGAVSSPTYISEAAANIGALQNFIKAKAKPKDYLKALPMLGANLSYLATLALLAAGTYAIRSATSKKPPQNKKVAANRTQQDDERLINNQPGPTHNQVPGDFLGLPHSSLVGMRHIIGDPMSVSDRIDRQFRFMDEPMGTRVMEGNSAAFPESPGV